MHAITLPRIWLRLFQITQFISSNETEYLEINVKIFSELHKNIVLKH